MLWLAIQQLQHCQMYKLCHSLKMKCKFEYTQWLLFWTMLFTPLNTYLQYERRVESLLTSIFHSPLILNSKSFFNRNTISDLSNLVNGNQFIIYVNIVISLCTTVNDKLELIIFKKSTNQFVKLSFNSSM